MSKPNFVKLATEAGDQYLAALAETQEAFLKSLAALSTPPPPPPAFTPALPTFQEMAEASFAFTQKLLKQQKDFTEKLFATATPASSS